MAVGTIILSEQSIYYSRNYKKDEMKNTKLTLPDLRKEQLIHLNVEEMSSVKGGNPTLAFIPLPGARVFCDRGIRKDRAWWRAPGRIVLKEIEPEQRISPLWDPIHRY